MSGNLGQQAVHSRSIIVMTESLTNIGDFIVSMPPLTAEQQVHFNAICGGHQIGVAAELNNLGTELLDGYHHTCPRDYFNTQLRLRNPEFCGNSVTVRLGNYNVDPYEVYLALLSVGWGQWGKSDLESRYMAVAARLGSCLVLDGLPYCYSPPVHRIKRLCEDIIVPIYCSWFDQYLTAFRYHVVRERLRIAPLDPESPQTVVFFTQGQLELRDQFVQIGWAFSEHFLRERGYPAPFIAELHKLNFYLVADDKLEALQRMQDRSVEKRCADLYSTPKQNDFFAFDLQALAFSAASFPRNDRVQQFTNRLDQEIQRLEMNAFPVIASPHRSDVTIAFWTLFNMSYELAQGLYDILPFWTFRTSATYAVRQAHIDQFTKTLALFRKQKELSRGVYGLTSVPLYRLTFEVLLQCSRSLHALHVLIASDLSILEPVLLQSLAAWPSTTWLRERGIYAEIC